MFTRNKAAGRECNWFARNGRWRGEGDSALGEFSLSLSLVSANASSLLFRFEAWCVSSALCGYGRRAVGCKWTISYASHACLEAAHGRARIISRD